MKNRHLSAAFCLYLLLMSDSQFAHADCVSMRKAMKSAYYAQIDLIRRGLPRLVVQAEYAWATNQLCKHDPYFHYNDNLSDFCVWYRVWNQLYDSRDRAWYALKYIKHIISWKPKIHFITFKKRRRLPRMTSEEQNIVDAHWKASEAVFRYPKRNYYAYHKFSFPKNIEILYDPYQETACDQYYRHGPLDVPRALDARTVLIALLIASVKLCKLGGDLDEIALMFRHFVAFAFNGIRCVRAEGTAIKIPPKVLRAYAAKVGKIYGAIINPAPLSLITMEAVESFFPSEIDTMTSYASWGNTEYAELTNTTSVPKVYNSMTKVLSKDTYDELGFMSATQLVREGLVDQSNVRTVSGRPFVFNMTMHQLKPNWSVTSASSRQVDCDYEYVYSPRSAPVESVYEHCCATLCDIWGHVSGYDLASPYEDCCSRCNQHYCPGTVTWHDISDSDSTEVLVPEFGEQDSYEVRLIMI